MPKLSIIVPTRERADTLLHTLRTIVTQDFDACEVIVSDNASADDTRAVVESFADPRVRYINPGRRLSMSDNWEFALEHARGTFVTYMGDDDGFIPGALAKSMSLIDQSGLDALVWDKVDYCWPDYVAPEMRNWFSFSGGDMGVQTVSGRQKLRKVIMFREAYTRLPCLYNGLIRKSLLDRIKSESTNKTFFNAISPDIYSGIALATIVGDYLHSTYPFSVNGASRHSNGTSFTRGQMNDPNSPAAKFHAENTRQYDPAIRMAPCAAVCVMGEYLLARDFLPTLVVDEPSWELYVRSLIRNAAGSQHPAAILDSAAHTVRSRKLSTRVPDRLDAPRPSGVDIGFKGTSFSFKVPHEMVANVYDACVLVAGMLPPAPGTGARSPVNRFIGNVRQTLISEAKTLYRAL